MLPAPPADGPFAASLPAALTPILTKYAAALELEVDGQAAYLFHPPNGSNDRPMDGSALAPPDEGDGGGRGVPERAIVAGVPSCFCAVMFKDNGTISCHGFRSQLLTRDKTVRNNKKTAAIIPENLPLPPDVILIML